MKCMIVWSIKTEIRKEALERFKSGVEIFPEGVKLLGRWHEVGTGNGFTLLDVDDSVALTQFVFQWWDLVDMKIVPVVEDAEVGEAIARGS